MDFTGPDDGVETLIRANPAERFLTPPSGPRSIERSRVVALFVGFLLCHIGVAALFLFEDDPPVSPPEQEISVEVVPPPDAAPPPPPPQPEQQQPPPKEQAKQPPPPPLDMTPAHDAPRQENKETVDREAPDKVTQAPREAPPAEQGTAGKTPDPPATARSTDAPTPGPVVENQAEDKPDAEVIEHAEAKPEAPQKATSPEPKAQNGTNMPTIAQMMARLEPVPDYKIAGKAPPSPVSGGTAKPNYLSILHGMIVPRFHRPAVPKSTGQIVIYIDTIGHILHQGLVQPSGNAALDNAAMAAVRSAAPFPTPPPGLPPVIWTYQ